eukprot:366417-Chlamydomonas_euryale.AAC.24
MAFAVRRERLGAAPEVVVQLAGALKEARTHERREDGVDERRVVRHIGRHDDECSARRQAALEVQADGAEKVALTLLDHARRLLLPRLQQPLVVALLQALDVWVAR